MRKKRLIIIICVLIAFFYFSFKGMKASANENLVLEEQIETSINTNVQTSLIDNLDEVEKNFSVTFDLNGGTYNGSSNDFEEIYIENSLIDEPDSTKLSRYNCTFSGWYTLENKIWNFNEDKITENITLRAKWNWSTLYPIYNYGKWRTVEDYLLQKHYNSFNMMKEFHQLKDVAGKNIIEMQGEDFPESEILDAISQAGVSSTYGGCGPIAMMGVMHYFSDALGYNEIIEDPSNSSQRVALAREILYNTPTTEIGFVGDKSTFTWPEDYESSFNKLMEEYNLSDKIKSSDNGFLFQNFTKTIEKIKESVNKGLPVTLYTSISGSSDSPIKAHYVNVYGYQDWIIKDRDGNYKTETILLYRQNWGWDEDNYRYGISYLDAEILKKSFSGIITYEILDYDNEKVIKASDFSTQFINQDTGNGQYFFDPIEASIQTSSGYEFDTERLRCSYIEKQYLVLSANRIGAGKAYLEFKLQNYIKKISFDMSLWSGLEGLNIGGDIIVQYFDVSRENGNEWVELVSYNPNDLGHLKAYPDSFIILFPKNVSRFRFLVTKENPNMDRNKGRVVLDNIHIFYDDIDQPHTHHYLYKAIDSRQHRRACSCGEITTQPHMISPSDTGKRYANCIQCGYLLDLGTDIGIVGPINALENNPQFYTKNGNYFLLNNIILVVGDLENFLRSDLE